MLVRKLFDRMVSRKRIVASPRKSIGRRMRRATFRDGFSSSCQFETFENRRLLVLGAFAIPAAVPPDFSGVVFLGASRGGCGGTSKYRRSRSHRRSRRRSTTVDFRIEFRGSLALTDVPELEPPQGGALRRSPRRSALG